MKVKLDENLPVSLVLLLKALGHDADTVPSEGLTGRDDESIWQRAQADRRFLITQDLDFSDLRRFSPGSHHGVMLVRLRNPGRMALRQRVELVFRTEQVEDWAGCFVVVTDRKVRVRRA